MSQLASDRGYALQNSWEKEHRRLQLLEAALDPMTTARLVELGVGPGLRVLEVGAGRGSITRWLCDRVGETGTVTALDLDPRFVLADPRPNLEVLAHDLLAAPIPGGDYDLVHVRALLMHLPGATALLAALLAALRPGGVLLVEEGDCHPLYSATSAGYVAAAHACVEAVATRGGDWTWARGLPDALVAAGAVDVGAWSVTPMFSGGCGLAEFWALSLEQVEPLLLSGGLDPATLAEAREQLLDPTRWFPFLAMVSGWGRRSG